LIEIDAKVTNALVCRLMCAIHYQTERAGFKGLLLALEIRIRKGYERSSYKLKKAPVEGHIKNGGAVGEHKWDGGTGGFINGIRGGEAR
jgi:hypothetical protein